MVKSLYITSLEQESGKTVAALGLMEQLCGRFKSVSVFRPVIAEGGGADGLLAIMTERYHLPFAAEDQYGVTYEVAQTLLSAGKYEELYNQVLEKFKALESRCDFVLVVGTDYTGVSVALEFDFNVEMRETSGRLCCRLSTDVARIPGRLSGRCGHCLNRWRPRSAMSLPLSSIASKRISVKVS